MIVSLINNDLKIGFLLFLKWKSIHSERWSRQLSNPGSLFISFQKPWIELFKMDKKFSVSFENSFDNNPFAKIRDIYFNMFTSTWLPENIKSTEEALNLVDYRLLKISKLISFI